MKCLSSNFRDAYFLAKESLGRKISKRTYQFGFDGLNLLKQKRFAGVDLIGLGIAVVGRSTFNDVGNVNVVTRKPNRFKEFGKKFACCSDEGNTLLVFMETRGFSNKHDGSMRVSGSKDDLRATRGKSASLTIVKMRLKFVEVHEGLLIYSINFTIADNGSIPSSLRRKGDI